MHIYFTECIYELMLKSIYLMPHEIYYACVPVRDIHLHFPQPHPLFPQKTTISSNQGARMLLPWLREVVPRHEEKLLHQPFKWPCWLMLTWMKLPLCGFYDRIFLGKNDPNMNERWHCSKGYHTICMVSQVQKKSNRKQKPVHSFHTTSQHLYITIEHHYQLDIVRPY